MFEFLQDLPTPIALNAAHQALRLLQHRIKPTVPRSKVVIEGISSSPSALEFKMARKIVKEIQQIEGRSILSVEPKRVQKYVVTLADLMQARVKRETNFEPGSAQGLLDNLKKYQPTRGSKYLKRRKTLRKKTGAVVV